MAALSMPDHPPNIKICHMKTLVSFFLLKLLISLHASFTCPLCINYVLIAVRKYPIGNLRSGLFWLTINDKSQLWQGTHDRRSVQWLVITSTQRKKDECWNSAHLLLLLTSGPQNIDWYTHI